jgi:hypothetical protein
MQGERTGMEVEEEEKKERESEGTILQPPVVIGRKKGKAPQIRKIKLKYPELSNGEIAKMVQCDESNVRQVLRRFMGKIDKKELSDFQESKAEIYDTMQYRLLESISEDKLIKMQPYPAVVAASILEDKARLIRGQATGINVSVLIDLVDAIKSQRR